MGKTLRKNRSNRNNISNIRNRRNIRSKRKSRRKRKTRRRSYRKNLINNEYSGGGVMRGLQGLFAPNHRINANIKQLIKLVYLIYYREDCYNKDTGEKDISKTPCIGPVDIKNKSKKGFLKGIFSRNNKDPNSKLKDEVNKLQLKQEFLTKFINEKEQYIQLRKSQITRTGGSIRKDGRGVQRGLTAAAATGAATATGIATAALAPALAAAAGTTGVIWSIKKLYNKKRNDFESSINTTWDNLVNSSEGDENLRLTEMDNFLDDLETLHTTISNQIEKIKEQINYNKSTDKDISDDPSDTTS